MADQFVPITAGSGTKIQVYENTVNGQVVEAQAVVLVNSLGVPSVSSLARTRVSIVFQSTATATADTLLSLVKVSNGVAAAGATSIGVTSGKTLRINSVVFGVRAGAATVAFGTLTLRTNPAGATVIGSPSELRLDSGLTAATTNSSVSVNVGIEGGLEYSGTQTIGASLIAQATTNVISVALIGYEY